SQRLGFPTPDRDRAGLTVAFVATHLPRQCGIATFTQDLSDAVVGAWRGIRALYAAIEEPGERRDYEPAVRWRIEQGNALSYREAAERINVSNVDVVSLQHEFGLYGLWGELFEDHLTGFLTALRRPLVTTLHTVPPDPSPSVREAVRRLARHSARVVAMAE